MSLDATKWAWTQIADRELAAGESLVLLRVADHASRQADGRFTCWPGVEELAENTGRNEKSVRRALSSLEAAGLLSRERRPAATGRGRAWDLIVLPIEAKTKRTESPVEEPDQADKMSGRSACSSGQCEPSKRTKQDVQPDIPDPAIDGRTGSEPLGTVAAAPGSPPATEQEQVLVRRLVQAFNARAATTYSPTAYGEQVLACVRAHPELSEEDHLQLVPAAFRVSWWKPREPSPAVIWGNLRLFDRTLHESRRQDSGQPSYDDSAEVIEV